MRPLSVRLLALSFDIIFLIKRGSGLGKGRKKKRERKKRGEKRKEEASHFPRSPANERGEGRPGNDFLVVFRSRTMEFYPQTGYRSRYLTDLPANANK